MIWTCVYVEASEWQLYRHSLSGGCGHPVSNGKGQWSFPSTCSYPLSICMLGEVQSQSWMGFEEGFTKGKNPGGLDVEPKTVSISGFFSAKEFLLLEARFGNDYSKMNSVFFSFGDLMNSNCITSFFWFFLFYLPLAWYTRYRNVEGKTGRCEAIKPNFKKSKIGRKKWDGFIVTEQLLKKSTAVLLWIYFAVNIFIFLLCEAGCVSALGLQVSEVEGGDHFLNICTGRRTRLETAVKIALCMSPRIG